MIVLNYRELLILLKDDYKSDILKDCTIVDLVENTPIFLMEFFSLDTDIISIIEENFDVFCEIISPLKEIKNVPQNNKWHFGDVYTHTMVALSMCKTNDWVVRLAVLLHDVGKKQCRAFVDGCDHFYGHPKRGKDIVTKWGSEVGLGDTYRNADSDFSVLSEIVCLIEYHDYQVPLTLKSLTRLDKKLLLGGSCIESWLLLREADILAHNNYDSILKDIDNCWMLIKERKEEDALTLLSSLMPINGNDIKELGFKGKEIGVVKQKCFEHYAITKCSKDDLIAYIQGNLGYIRGTYL